jgi:tetratricopeptide (TPR) repeat protein
MKLTVWLLIPFVGFAQTDCAPGDAYFKKAQYQQAESAYLECLKSTPDNASVLEALGDVKCAEKKWKSGLVYFEKLRNRFPKNAEYHYKYGGAMGMVAKESNKFKALGMIGDVRESFEKAIALNPKHINARWALIELYLQLPGIIGGSESKAKRYADELQKLSPVDGYLAHGRIAEYFSRKPEAEKQYKKAVDIGGSKTTYQKLADFYTKTGQPEMAKKVMAEYHSKTKS